MPLRTLQPQKQNREKSGFGALSLIAAALPWHPKLIRLSFASYQNVHTESPSKEKET